MKRVIVAVQNVLVSEVVLNALKQRGILAERAPLAGAGTVADLCDAFLTDVLVMDVTRFGEGTFDNRMETVKAVKKIDPKIRICLICDNVSEANCRIRSQMPKKWG